MYATMCNKTMWCRKNENNRDTCDFYCITIFILINIIKLMMFLSIV